MKIFEPNGKTSLKELLVSEGYRFPCGGKGICGRCLIRAEKLPITRLDRRFISDFDLNAGIRLACDKVIEEALEIDEIFMPKALNVERLEEPQIAAVFRNGYLELSLVDEDLVEAVHYEIKDTTLLGLRALVQKNSIEFFEKYKVAKAVSILLAGEAEIIKTLTGKEEFEDEITVYPASLFDMPSEEVILPPFAGSTLGSDILLELLELKDNCLYVNIDQCVFIYKGESIIAAKLCDEKETQEALTRSSINENSAAFIATLKLYYQLYAPEKTFISSREIDPETLNKIPALESYTFEKHISKASKAAVEALIDNKTKTALNKLKRKTEILSLADIDEWQNLFTETANS